MRLIFLKSLFENSTPRRLLPSRAADLRLFAVADLIQIRRKYQHLIRSAFDKVLKS